MPTLPTQPQTRGLNGTIQRATETENQYTLSFSSEEPYNRWYGPEILDHSPGAVDLSRLNDIGVFLFNHDTDKILGKVVNAKLENNRGVAVVELDNDSFAQEMKGKIDNGTLKGVSVRYSVSVWEEVEEGATSSDGRFKGPCSIAKKWTPLEISAVSVPADPTVGVGRSENEGQDKGGNQTMPTNEQNPTRQEPVGTPVSPAQQPEPTPQRQEPTPPVTTPSVNPLTEDQARAIQEAERSRVSEITDLCREFGLDSKQYIADGTDVEQVRSAVLEHLRKERKPVENVHVTVDEKDKFRSAVSDSLLLRSGLTVATPAEGANEFRSMRIRDIINECARQDGTANPERMSTDDLLRQYFSPASSFGSVLDDTVQKSYVAGYQSAPTSFELWTTKGELKDFRTSKSYTHGSAGEFLEVPEGGELKHDAFGPKEKPSRQLKTYGRQFTLTREAIINDDISFVTTIPAQYAIASKRTINRQVYGILAHNETIYDGDKLFSKAHNNIITPGDTPTIQSLQEAMKLLAVMQDEEGNPIYAIPKYVLCPIGLGDVFRQIISSQTIVVTVGGVATAQNNPLYNRNLEVVEEVLLNTLNANGEIQWYLVADPTTVPSIQVDYLNGNEMPLIRMMEYPGQLGFIWDIYLDWGITALDFRGIIKNEGGKADDSVDGNTKGGKK